MKLSVSSTLFQAFATKLQLFVASHEIRITLQGLDLNPQMS